MHEIFIDQSHKAHEKFRLGYKDQSVNPLPPSMDLMEIDYPQWVSNSVHIAKESENIHICMEYQDLKLTCLKDDFILANINQFEDFNIGCEMFSLMDGFYGYNQILIAPKEQHKTSFITPLGKFCYHVMPFGLKNSGSTY